MEPLFSVVIPVYNVEKYLAECINSVLSQIHDVGYSLEIILVDDGSTDSSGVLCDNFANNYENIIVIHQENQGLLLARRIGYRASRGKYVINLDSDDLLTENAISSIADTIEKSKADIIFYNISVMNKSGIESYYRDVFTDKPGCLVTKDQVIEAYFNYSIPIVTSMAGKAIRRECINTDYDYSKFGKLSMGEDTLQTAEVVSKAASFYYLNKNIYVYRMGSGMTSKFDPEFYNTFKKIIMEVKSISGFANEDKYMPIYNEKIISLGCRAITQSKLVRMRYPARKKFIKGIVEDEVFRRALAEVNPNSDKIKMKYKFMIRLINIHAYLLLHIILNLMN